MNVPPFHWWRTVFVLIPVIGTYTIVLGILSLLSTVAGGRGRFAHRCAQWWARLILVTSGVRVERGGAPLPADEMSCVYVSNHASIYDIPILFTSVPRQLRILAKASLGSFPFVGWHLKRSGHLLVDQKTAGTSTFRKMKQMVQQGASLIVFPEGARTDDGLVHAFKRGPFLLAIESGLPIVPMSIANSRAVMLKGELTVRPARVRVTVHERIETSGLTRDDARALAARVQAIVAADVDAARARGESA